MKCQLYPELDAEVKVRCGFYKDVYPDSEMVDHYFSRKAAKEHWERIKEIVGQGLYHYIIKDYGT